jgi:hypothetical protein
MTRKKRAKALTDAQKEKVQSLYRKGHPVKNIAESVKKPYTQIRGYASKMIAEGLVQRRHSKQTAKVASNDISLRDESKLPILRKETTPVRAKVNEMISLKFDLREGTNFDITVRGKTIQFTQS